MTLDLTKPSRELDAWVAEKVMGKQVRNYWVIDGFHNDGRPHSQCPVEHYSSDIAAAWEVVEKLTDQSKPHFELSKGYEGWWHVGFDLDRPFKRVIAKADTAPLAICLAALKSIGAI